MNLPSSTHYDKLIARAQTLSAAPCAIAHPAMNVAVGRAGSARPGLLHPILVGPERKIRDTAAQFRLNLATRASSTRRTATRPPRPPWRWCAPARPAC